MSVGVLIAMALTLPGAGDATVFRSGDELIVALPELDLWRQTNSRLLALVKLSGEKGVKEFRVDLKDPVVASALVFDVKGFGECSRVAVEVTDGAGKTLESRDVRPVPTVAVRGNAPIRAGEFAAIEPGTARIAADRSPLRIPQPDATRLRREALVAAPVAVTTGEITYPVVTDSDLPIPASENYVLVSRQSRAPNDATGCSLYFSYRKAIYDATSMRLRKWRKLLVEVPLERSWLERNGDEVLTLPLQEFAVHSTEERAPRGTNMLGENAGGLAQGGQSADIDDQGRIYFSNLSDGSGLARFNPHTAKFEQPPVDFNQEIRRLIPAEGDWKRSWDTDLGNLLCLRDRVFIVFGRNYRTRTPNGNFEACSGVISVPQEGWDDAAAFRSDIRLHAGSWSGASHALYDGPPQPGFYDRKIGNPIATQHGLFFSSPPDCIGGPWRMDLDARGNTMALAVVKSIDAPASAAGGDLPKTAPIKIHGLPKQRMINVGSAGRQFVRIHSSEFEISRAALALTLPGAPEKDLVDAGGRHRSTFEGAPQGMLTVRFDIAGAIKADPMRSGELATALSGLSLGPNYSVTPVPGEAGRAIAVCEYGYYFSKLDFSRRARERRVFKTYLPSLSHGQSTGLPARVGLGPYNAAWAEHDDSLWLYLPGYTGMTRLKYSTGGKPLVAFAAEMFHGRLAPRPADGRPRDGVKDFLHIMPALGGRMIDIGRGRAGRGGGAYSAGLEIFDPSALGGSQTLVAMNRCYGLYTPASRLVFSTAREPRQEIYAASGPIRLEYVEDIPEPALRPASREPKIFCYECTPDGNLRDLFGFAVPARPDGSDSSGSLALSPCGQFLVLMQKGGRLFTFSVPQKAWIDGVQLENSTGGPAQILSFDRPSADLWLAPNGQLFFHAALEGSKSRHVGFFEVAVSTAGRIAIRPHRTVFVEGDAKASDFDGIVRCFLPDLARNDGSYDFVLGGNQENGPPSVRVMDDFIPPR